MRSLSCLFLSLLVLAGCSRRTPPPAAGLSPVSAPALAPIEGADEFVAPGEPAYLGRSAQSWARGLSSADNGVRLQAGMALRQLGPAGYPKLKDAIENGKSAETRLAALQALYKTELVSHRDMVGVLTRLLQSDPNEAVREQAAIRLAWFDAGGRPALAALQEAARRDPDPKVRQAAANSQTCIHEAVTGTIKKSD
jgi:hypothetical protein